MKRSTKITSIIITFFLIIVIVVIGRMMIGNHFAKKFSKRPPPGIIVTEVVKTDFSEKIESFGKSFDQLTKETVRAFLIDSKKSKFKIWRFIEFTYIQFNLQT